MDLKHLIDNKIKTEDIESKVQQQARDYIKRADLILFLIDTKAGLLPQDRQMVLIMKKILPKTDNVILIANKVDGVKERNKIAEFYKLSLGDPIPLSAATGSGTGDLLDIIVKRIKTVKKIIKKEEEQVLNSINVCILGKPNVGKSSLLNKILGEERVIVSPTPHTTREPQDTDIVYKDKIIKLIDTAGISKSKSKKLNIKSKKLKSDLEALGIAKSLGTLKRADIALFVVDINEEITHQDARIIAEIVDRKKSLIFIANKWDLVPFKDTKEYTNYIYSELPFVPWAPIQFTSALTGEKTSKIMDLILDISEKRKRELSDSQLDKFLKKIVKIHKPAKGKGTKHPRIYELKQVRANPPKFIARIGAKDDLHFSYVRFIENRLREKFDFLGTPVSILVVKNRAIHGKSEIDFKNNNNKKKNNENNSRLGKSE